MGRAPCCDKANVKRGPWSPEEDIILKTYVESHGAVGNWIALPQKAGLRRCGKSCRLRWLNYLRPDIKHGGFTEEEDNVICTLYKNIGSRWSVIASQLEGRTDNDVKNYWNTKLKKKILAGKINLNDHPTTSSSPSPAMLKHNSSTMPLSMDASSRQDVGSLSAFSESNQFSMPGVPLVSSDFGTSSSDVSLPLDYSSWWGGNGIEEDYRFFEDFGLGSSYDILLCGGIGPNNHANYSTSDNFMSNTSDTKPQGMYHSITN